jgi:hypothetical protein
MSGPLLSSNTEIVCPVVGREPMVLDLTEIYVVEQRIDEVAFVTKGKAPELLATFNRAYLALHKAVTLLEYELVQANVEAEKVKAVVILDRAPGILEAKGLLKGQGRSGSVDQREAVLAQDSEYQEALDRTEKLKCIIKLLQGKLKGLEWAYTSVKKVYGDGGSNLLDRTIGPGSGSGEAPVGGTNADPHPSVGFGRAKY